MMVGTRACLMDVPDCFREIMSKQLIDFFLFSQRCLVGIVRCNAAAYN